MLEETRCCLYSLGGNLFENIYSLEKGRDNLGIMCGPARGVS